MRLRLRLALGSTCIILATGAAAMNAVAADLPAKAPAAAIPPPPPIDWTGLYLGAHAGYGWGDKTWTVGLQPQITPFSTSGDVDGFLGGFHGGFNYQIGRIVLGVEGQWSWSGMSGSHVGSIAGFTNTLAVDIDWVATLTGRLGYAFHRWLFYVNGGGVWARETYDAQLGAFPVLFQARETRSGWTIGAGAEYAFDRNWSARLDYSYMHIESGHDGRGGVRFTGVGVVPVPPPPPPPPVIPPPEIFDSEIKQNIHAIKIGISYRFNPAPAPIIAKY